MISCEKQRNFHSSSRALRCCLCMMPDQPPPPPPPPPHCHNLDQIQVHDTFDSATSAITVQPTSLSSLFKQPPSPPPPPPLHLCPTTKEMTRSSRRAALAPKTACPANMTPTQQEQQQTGAAAQASKSLDMLSRLGVVAVCACGDLAVQLDVFCQM